MENLTNIYLLKAIEAYPYELEKAVEALNYALSFDPESVKALHLMGKVYSEQLGDNETAKEFFEEAMAVNLKYTAIYPDFISLLVNNEDYKEAQKLIDFALTVKGIDKAGIKLNQAYLYEAIQEFEQAEEALQEAKLFGMNDDFIHYCDDMISRVSKKRKITNNKNRVIENTQQNQTKVSQKSWLSSLL